MQDIHAYGTRAFHICEIVKASYYFMVQFGSKVDTTSKAQKLFGFKPVMLKYPLSWFCFSKIKVTSQ